MGAKLNADLWANLAPAGGLAQLDPPNVPGRPDSASFHLKRTIDLIGALTGLILLAPLMAMIALAIRMESRGPIFFRQERLGLGGRVFRCLKFRTMMADDEPGRQVVENRDESTSPILLKIKEDPKLTTLGRILLRHRLERLPQLWNVLVGEMSLVGPRPLQLRESEKLKALNQDRHARRLSFPPGIIGPWNLTGRDYPKGTSMAHFDSIYMNSWSIEMDLRILVNALKRHPDLITASCVAPFLLLIGISLTPFIVPTYWVWTLAEKSMAASRSASSEFNSFEINEIDCGETKYPLPNSNPVTVTITGLPNGKWTCSVQGLGLVDVGIGASQEEAFQEWKDLFHISFQCLYGKSEHEMSPEELQGWKEIESTIDVDRYTAQRPLVLNQIGTVTRIKPRPCVITWLDDRVEEVRLSDLPAEFARFKQGQWFEATLERDRTNQELRKIRNVRPVAPVEPMDAARLERFWESLPTTASLPQSTRDWTKR